jgi:hypothetical protein
MVIISSGQKQHSLEIAFSHLGIIVLLLLSIFGSHHKVSYGGRGVQQLSGPIFPNKVGG